MPRPTPETEPFLLEVPYIDQVEAFRRLRTGPAVLLDSAGGPGHLSRYSFLGIEPYLRFRCRDSRVEVSGNGVRESSDVHPLKKLRELLKAVSVSPRPDLPPFNGGAMGVFNYDFVRYVERFRPRALDDLHIPEADFLMVDRFVAWDHQTRKTWVAVVPGLREGTGSTADAQTPEAAAERIATRLSSPAPTEREERPDRPPFRVHHEMPREEYESIVMRAKEYIAAGDIFQANLSQRIRAELPGIEPWKLYTVLRGINPSPFAAYADFGDYVIASSSPERLIRFTPEQADTRPIAGTRPRGADSAEDTRMRSELLLNEKERAEHIMLLDLERNDLGKFCDYGSVEIDELMVTEDYSHVIHIVSNVRGRPARGMDWADAVRGVFPGGTITGVPKVRCMQIIDELEPVRRGPYTGSMGYVSFDGRMDLNIIIRTFVIREGTAYVQAGAGIVADSDPSREYEETLKKAEALIRTVERL